MNIDAYRRGRLQELVDKEAAGNVAAFARAHNQDPARLRQILNENYRGGRSFGEGVARRLESDLGLPPLYFDLGIEEQVAGEHRLVVAELANKASKRGVTSDSLTETISNIGKTDVREFDKNVAPAEVGTRLVPVISYVQAGQMTEVVDPFALGGSFEFISTDLDLSGRAFALIIKGPSMEPEFREGDKVIIDPAVCPQPGDFVVAKNSVEEATFKKYRPRGTDARGNMIFELVPLNDDFPTLNSDRDHLIVIGVMMEHRKYRKR
jgi:SOS-response transcriptional repressor LexA